EVIQHALDHFDEAREQEFYIPCRNGAQLPVIVSGRHLEGPPPLSNHRIITVIGISQQKRAEHEVQERYRDIATLSDTILEQALELKNYSRNLEERVRLRTQELHKANMEAIFMLAVASEAKDRDTGSHVRRIEHSARLIAKELGLSESESDRIGYSAILHDVGKIHVPDAVLIKPAALTKEEWVTMRQHTTAGERILSREPFFDVARDIARSHHENYDGSGYPDGISGNAIPLSARIVRVADVYDALTSVRPYKHAWSREKAAEEIHDGVDIQFDPQVVAAFLKLFERNELPAANATTRSSIGTQPG
ncbi:MAG TPA: HD domain-containing phosphohydrolase, partial [Phycisphaerales bacterium]|nr:HD domain-containing phosphohydrolase [Phycisphaerales bacterium]